MDGGAGRLCDRGGAVFAAAQDEGGTKTAHELRADYDKALQGKTIAYLPIALGVPLMDEWGRVIQDRSRVARHEIRRPRSQQQSVGDAAGADRAGRREARRADRAEPERHAADEGTEARRKPGHARHPDQHVVELQVRRIRRRRLARNRQHAGAEDVVKQCGTGSRQVRQGADRAGRTGGGGERRPGRRHHGQC